MKYVLEEAYKYYPKLKLKYKLVKGKREERAYIHSMDKRGYTENGLKCRIIYAKLKLLVKLLDEIDVKSNLSLTNSLYFIYKSKFYRISDHLCNREHDFSYTIHYKTDENYLFNMILTHK